MARNAAGVRLYEEVALFVVDSVRQALARPIWMNQVVQIGVSIGLAIAPRDGSTRDELTRRADLALRTAKSRAADTVSRPLASLSIRFKQFRARSTTSASADLLA